MLLSSNVNTNHLPVTLKRAADSVHLPGDARAPSADRTLSSKADYKSQLTSGPVGGQGGKRGGKSLFCFPLTNQALLLAVAAALTYLGKGEKERSASGGMNGRVLSVAVGHGEVDNI